MTTDRYAERKALLVTKASLDRTRLALAAQELRSIVAPKADKARVAVLRSKVTWVVAAALPLIGAKRLHRLARLASYALMAIRVVRYWRSNP